MSTMRFSKPVAIVLALASGAGLILFNHFLASLNYRENRTHDAVLAAGLSRLAKIQEHAGSAVDSLAHDERRADQTQ
jgi:Ni/Fe-hydrogenase subunit HybB-like protein